MRIRTYTTLLSLFLTIVCAPRLQAQVACVVSDSLELVKLYNSTNGPNWTTSWDLMEPVHTWYGVYLDGLGNVACLDLDGGVDCNITSSPTGNNLNGNLVNLDLPFLRYLVLSNNKINGNIPEFDNLDILEILDLSLNRFTGSIPEFNNLVNLKFLQLCCNMLTDSIPDFDNLSELKELVLNNNQLVGSIPQFNNLKKLDDLYLYNNQLIGTIPQLNDLVKLKELRLQNNQLSGTIPPFDSLKFLRELYLENNKFSGISTFQHLDLNLTHLTLQYNKLNLTDLLLNLGIPNDTTNGYYYSPQDSIPLNLETGNLLRPIAGGNIQNNTYLWYLNENLVSTIIGDDEYSPTTSGTYYCKVTTPDLPSLTLYSKAQYINTCLIQDSLQLLKIHTATNGQNWDTLWNLNQPISTWHGITLTPDGCNVESIDFGFFGNGLTGTFPALDLGELKTLNLIRNELTAIESFDGLPSLEFLELSNNQLTALPSLDALVNLENLYLANNLLERVPDYSNLTQLKRLSLFTNQLEQVPDYSGLALLERLYIYGNQLSSIPSYDGLANLTHLSIDRNRLDFSDISPNGADFDYSPQDSIALAYQGGNLVFNVGGNLADNTYTWFVDSVAQAPVTGDNSFATTGAGQYRCEVTNSQLPDLTLYSYAINYCGNFTASEYLLPATNGILCQGEPITMSVYNFLNPTAPPSYSRYVFTVNGIVLQDAASNSFVTSILENGDIVSCIVYDNDCSYFTNEYTANFHDEIDLLICQDDPTQFNAKLQQGTAPWNFKLTEYNSGWRVKDSIYNIAVADINIPRNPNSSYEITEIADANCSSSETFQTATITGCGAICVGFSNPQIEYYTAQFSNPVTPGSIAWTVTPQAAIAAGDVELIGGTDNAVLQLNFPNAQPAYSQIQLSVSAETACGTEVQEYSVLLDNDCVWPGDVNDDGEIATTAPNRPWVNDAIGLSKAIAVVEAINNGNDNEVLYKYKRPLNCLADKPYDWVPQSARDWEFEATNTPSGPATFHYTDTLGNITSTHNLKYADANGNGSLEDGLFWNTFAADFDTLSQYSDFDVIAYNEYLGKTHDGNSYSYKTQVELPELIHITVADSVLASGDEVVFIATLGSLDNVIDSVIQVAFQADASFGTYKRPAIDVSSSHLGPNGYLNNSYKVDYPFVIPNWEGAEDSLQWLVSMHSPDFAPVSFAGEELCSARCYIVVVGAFTEDDPLPQNKNSSLGVARTFKVTAGIQLANGSVVNAQSNEVTVYIQPDPHLSARILLEGPYDVATGLMRDDLSQKLLIPALEPYSTQAGSEYFPKEELKGIGMTDGMAVLSVTGQDAIVDWVLIEVWQDSLLYCRRPALLTRSGNVVDIDGFSPVPMTRVPYGNYDVAIRHRNHLPVKTTAPVSLQRGVLSLDFTTMAAGQKEVAAGVFACYAGDASCVSHDCLNGYNVNGEDKGYWYNQNGLHFIYDNADFDMNADVNSFDRLLWEVNNGMFLGLWR